MRLKRGFPVHARALPCQSRPKTNAKFFAYSILEVTSRCLVTARLVFLPRFETFSNQNNFKQKVLNSLKN